MDEEEKSYQIAIFYFVAKEGGDYTKFELEAGRRTQKAADKTFYNSLLGRVQTSKWEKGSKTQLTISSVERDLFKRLAEQERMQA